MWSSWLRGRFRKSWPRWGGSSRWSQHLEANLQCLAGSKESSRSAGTVTESVKGVTDGQMQSPRGREKMTVGPNAHLGGQRLSQPNQTSTLPRAMNLNFQVWQIRPYASKAPPTSCLCIFCESTFGGSTNITCPHMYAPLDHSPPPTGV